MPNTWRLSVYLVMCLGTGSASLAIEPEKPLAGLGGLDLSADWPWWRGPSRDGVAATGQSPPLTWSDSEHIAWGTPIPGKGHGSPTIVGDQVFLATADAERSALAVLCLDRRSGALQWKTDVHRGKLETKGNGKSSLASGSVACDGARLFINFLHEGAVYATALDRQGRQLWQTKVSDFVMHQGYGASPTIVGSLVLIAADNKGGGAIVALERATGEVVWKHTRPARANYTSPMLFTLQGQPQIFMSGCDLVSSLDALTGKPLWQIEGSTTECVTSIVTDGRRIFTSGGYPRNHVAAVRVDGSGIEWNLNARVYVPSMIVRGGHLHAVQDAGVATCWKCETGAEVWKGRLGGTFSSSLVLVGEHLLATNEAGRTYIFKAEPSAFELVAENQLGDECMATPAVCGNRIYMRVARNINGQRQEMVYCVAD